jgi:hypothetical protein
MLNAGVHVHSANDACGPKLSNQLEDSGPNRSQDTKLVPVNRHYDGPVLLIASALSKISPCPFAS